MLRKAEILLGIFLVFKILFILKIWGKPIGKIEEYAT